MDPDTEQYILFVLADSNLPTGSFVASSGLESYHKHGFPSTPDSVTSFIRNSLHNYAHSTLPFVSSTHELLASPSLSLDEKLEELKRLDELCHATLLNQVSRRASTSQGVALLTLYVKGLAKPPTDPSAAKDEFLSLVESFKLSIRKQETPGHLPICWGILTSALGLPLNRAQYLHLFLHARSLLSASVRLNTIGPYQAHQTLLHTAKPMLDTIFESTSHLRHGDACNTWPLVDILSGRHDMLQSRIFNS